MWQHVNLSEQIRPWDTLACCWDFKHQQTNKPVDIKADALPFGHAGSQWPCVSHCAGRAILLTLPCYDVPVSDQRESLCRTCDTVDPALLWRSSQWPCVSHCAGRAILLILPCYDVPVSDPVWVTVQDVRYCWSCLAMTFQSVTQREPLCRTCDTVDPALLWRSLL